jgi:hypothetical protein
VFSCKNSLFIGVDFADFSKKNYVSKPLFLRGEFMQARLLFIFSLILSLFLTNPVISEDQSNLTDEKKADITFEEAIKGLETGKTSGNEKEKKVDTNDAAEIEKLLIEIKILEEKYNQKVEDSETKKVKDATSQKKAEKIEVKTSEKDKQAVKSGSDKTKSPDKKQARKKTEIQKDKVKLIKWENEAQEAKCNAYLEPLRENFLKTRHYSIQGDPCYTADYAKSFLSVAVDCERDCPKGFMEKKGFTKTIVRNINWLEKSGSERCLEAE